MRIETKLTLFCKHLCCYNVNPKPHNDAFICLLVVTRYIQSAVATQGVGMITLSCPTAPSDPPVRCDFIINCVNETTITVEPDDHYVHKTTQPCNFTVIVKLSNSYFTKILDQMIFTNVSPLVQPTTTVTTTTPTLMPPSGKHICVCESMCLHSCVHACVHVCVCVYVCVCVCKRPGRIRVPGNCNNMYCREKCSIKLLL